MIAQLHCFWPMGPHHVGVYGRAKALALLSGNEKRVKGAKVALSLLRTWPPFPPRSYLLKVSFPPRTAIMEAKSLLHRPLEDPGFQIISKIF